MSDVHCMINIEFGLRTTIRVFRQAQPQESSSSILDPDCFEPEPAYSEPEPACSGLCLVCFEL